MRAIPFLLFFACTEAPPVSPQSSASTQHPKALTNPSTGDRIDDGANRPILETALQSKDYSVRLVATEALACSFPSWSLPLLEKQLGDPEEDVRAAALVSFAYRTETRAGALLRTVRDDVTEGWALRALAVHSLLGPRTCPRYIQ